MFEKFKTVLNVLKVFFYFEQFFSQPCWKLLCNFFTAPSVLAVFAFAKVFPWLSEKKHRRVLLKDNLTIKKFASQDKSQKYNRKKSNRFRKFESNSDSQKMRKIYANKLSLRV